MRWTYHGGLAMSNMILWKLRRMIKTKPFYFMLAVMLATGLIYIPILIHDDTENAFELMCKTQSQLASLLDLFAGLYAALCITHDMQNRFVSSAVMAGNSRKTIVFTEILGFAVTIFISVLVPSVISYFAGVIFLGAGDAFAGGTTGVGTALLTSVLYAFVCASAFSIVIPFCFVIKTEGFSCIINLIVLILCWCGAQSLAEFGIEAILPYLTFGQLFILCGGELTASSVLLALGVSVINFAVLFAIAYIILKRTELK